MNKTTIDGKKFSYEETMTDMNRTKVETTFINTTLNETIEKQTNVKEMKGMDFMQEAQDYTRVIDDLKHILKGNTGDRHTAFHSQGNLKKKFSPRI